MTAPEPPFAAAHLLYTFTGSLPGGEIWSVGLRTVAANTLPAQLPGFATAANTAFSTFWNATNGPGSANPPAVAFLKTTVRQVRIDGTTSAVAEHPNTSIDVGAASTQGAPNQTALVVTTKTARAGRSSSGRFYLPWLTPSIGATTDRLSDGVCLGLANAAATLIGSIGTAISSTGVAPSGPFPIAIQSRVSGVGGNQVNLVQVGNVLDTQRRRRDKIIETRQTAPVVVAP